MLGAAEGGAGGSTAGLTTEANLAAARNRNSGGFGGSLDEMARQKDKALAGTSEGIAANSANLAQQQQQDAAKGLSNMYGQDTNAQMQALGIQSKDQEIQNQQPNWAQQLGQIGGAIKSFLPTNAGFKIPGMG
jgi:hypothetical protein